MRGFLFVVLALLSAPGLTMDFVNPESPLQRLEVAGIGRVDYQRLFTETSQEGETMDAFIVRIAPRLRAYSDSTGFEACGVVATDGQRFGVVIGSNRSHAACGNVDAFVPGGMKPTGQTVHSHRTGGLYRANENDRALMGGRVGASFKSAHPDEFSPEDFQAKGYLVGEGAVFHQTSKRSVRRVDAL